MTHPRQARLRAIISSFLVFVLGLSLINAQQPGARPRPVKVDHDQDRVGRRMPVQNRANQEPQDAKRDPAAIRGQWTYAGRSYQITNGDFQKLKTLMTAIHSSQSRRVNPENVWAHLLSLSEADAIGIAVDDKDLESILHLEEPSLNEALKIRWEAQGVNYQTLSPRCRQSPQAQKHVSQHRAHWNRRMLRQF